MKKLAYISLSIAVLALLFSCNGSDSSSSTSSSLLASSTSSDSGNLSIQLTDAPFPSDLIAEANVTIDKIEIRRVDDSDDYPYVTLSETDQSFNLLELTNGVTESLVDLDIDEGTYDLIRLHVSEASVVLNDGTEFDLAVPSGDQTGIKIAIDPAIYVAGGLSTELLLDFDVSRSFKIQGNPDTPAGIKGFMFTPSIKGANLSTSGRVVGDITDEYEQPIGGVLVTVYEAGTDTAYTSTLTDGSGGYAVLGLPEGDYDIVVEHADYISEEFEDVEIIAGNTTTQDARLVSSPEEDTEESDPEEDTGEDTEEDTDVIPY